MKGDLHFRETIRPPFWLLSFVAFMLASLVVAVWAAFTNLAAVVTALVSILLLIFFYLSNIHQLEIYDGELRIDRAHIPVHFLCDPINLAKKDFLIERTRNLDPAAFPAIIYWIPEGIKVIVNDSQDPTPYWLISTKRGPELVDALNRKSA